MTTNNQIHIIWECPFTLDEAEDLQHETNDFGLYQCTGGHVVYGNDLLLNIGKAGRQPIVRRLAQEKW